MKNKTPKLGKRAQAILNPQKEEESTSSKQPQTSQEYLELGSIEEESGDRWLGSDLSKALRFYQRAYLSYLKSIELDPNGLDNYYNSSRLLFHVYNQYFKTDGVKIYELSNVNEALTGDEYSVVQSLSNIVEAHERAVEVANSLKIKVPLDLLFNITLVYTEVIEIEQENDNSNFNEFLHLAFETQQIFQNLITLQVEELQKFLKDLQNIDTNPEVININFGGSSTKANSKKEELTSEEVLQPSDIFETIIAAYKLSQAILENITNVNEQLQQVLDLISPFLTFCEKIADDLIQTFGKVTNKNPDMVSSITEHQINEYRISKNYITGLTMNELPQLFELWNNQGLPDTPERYMSAADNIQTLIDRNDLSVSLANSNSTVAEIFWKALSQMSLHYKKAQELLTAVFNEKKKIPSGKEDGLGTLIAQISNVIIARSDIDLQRCQLTNYEPAVKNRQILLQNSKTLLKNAMNLANTSGGLRERITEKVQREKKKSDAVLRLCILENKHSVEELDSILGRTRWVSELPYLTKLGYFDEFGINTIQVPTNF